MFKCAISKIPARYNEDYKNEQLKLIKSRVRLLCVLTVVVYFVLSFMDYAFNRSEHILLEIAAGIALTAAALFILFLDSRTKSLKKTRSMAFFFVSVLVLILIRLGICYYESPAVSSAGYIFAMFIVIMTIPWSPIEVIPLGGLFLGGFIAENLIVSAIRSVPLEADFSSGIIFVTVAAALCVFLRRKELERDVDNFVLLKAVEEKNDQMKKDLEMATRVHKTIIPDGINTDLVNIKVTYLPAYYVGGDYARYVFLPGDKITFIISDVTGHGIPAALLVNRMHAEFERIAKEGKPPGELMKDLNAFIKDDFEGSGMYLTAFCGQLDMKKMTLLYSNYAHPPQYLFKAKTGKLKSMPSLAGMLGIYSSDPEIYQEEITVGAGDRLLLYTDGVTETFNALGEEYGIARLQHFFLTNHLLPVENMDTELMAELNEFKSGNFRDDICLLDIGIRAHSSFLQNIMSSKA